MTSNTNLRYFVSVAERLSFRRAADALATSQPSLSQQIIALEDELHVRLFDRSRQKVELTPAGEFYLHEVRRIFDALHTANEQVAHVDAARPSEVVLGCARGTMVRYVPGMILTMRGAYPDVTVKVRSIQQVELLGQVRERSVQLAFVYGPVHDPALHSEPLWDHGFCVVLPVHHPAARLETVDPDHLRGEHLIHYARTTSEQIHDAIVEICRDADLAPRDVQQSQASSRIIGKVASGDGIAIVPDQWRVIGTPGVVFRPLRLDRLRRLAISACWHRDERASIVREFIAVARASSGFGLLSSTAGAS